MKASKRLILADYIIISPFAWIISQAIIRLDIFWFFIGLWMFSIYARNRGGWDVR